MKKNSTEVPLESIKELREMTSCGVLECKKALEEAQGDFQKAKEILQKKGRELAESKKDRATRAGRVEAYVHLGSQIGVLVEVDCETDFVAKSEDFCAFTKDLALQITAGAPRYIKKEDVPPQILETQSDPEEFLKVNCLMNQAFIKNPQLTIQDYFNQLVAKIKENISIRRFVRYQVGESE